MSKPKHQTIRNSNWRGFTPQLFLITVLPLTLLLLLVAFGSQTLHHKAMRSLVGDRNLRTVRAASNSLELEISHLINTINILSRSLKEETNFSSDVLHAEEISDAFDGGIALYSIENRLIYASTNQIGWQTIPTQATDFFKNVIINNNQPIFSTLINLPQSASPYIFIGILTDQNEVMLGAFSPGRLIEKTIGNLISSGQITVLVISPTLSNEDYDVLYRGGPLNLDENLPSHPGIKEALNGESGINYFQSSEGEHVVAFNPIPPTGWGLIIEEAWEDIGSPYLSTTQSAPLVIVPVFLLALIAIWFGARRIVAPLRKLEKQAASLAQGDFEAIRQPVGGIEEIYNLQTELIEMADKLNAAQQNLHSYIGAITAGVENERRSLARELHDDTIQTLIALNQRIQLILIKSPETQKDSLGELQTLVQQSMVNLRRMIRGLRPIYLEDLGLVAALEMMANEIGQAANILIIFYSKGQEQRFGSQIEMSLYRMIQESLNNVAHHSNASQAWVDLDFKNSELIISIRDNGKGFVVPTNPAEFPEKGHFGLLGLKERAELINSNLEIISSPGKGTTIIIRLDYNNI